MSSRQYDHHGFLKWKLGDQISRLHWWPQKSNVDNLVTKRITLVAGYNVLALNIDPRKPLFVVGEYRAKIQTQPYGDTNINETTVNVFWRTHRFQHALH